MKIRTKHIFILVAVLIPVLLYQGCAPIREFYHFSEYRGKNNFVYKTPAFDSTKKTIVIVADNNGTEIFDLMAPFYLFNITRQANVFIVAERKYPIVVMKGFYTLPHYTYSEIDSLHIHPSAIVIPNLSAMEKKDVNPLVVQWIKNKYTDTPKILSICVGAMTAAATGLYNGKPLATHASEYKSLKKQFNEPAWANNVSVIKSDNLYSTGGVSNAVEGSLSIIRDLFGEQAMHAAMDSIHYPHPNIKSEHNSIAVNTGSKLTIANKVYFKKNRKIGVLLQNGVNEFKLAAVLDTYHRTFPKSIETFVTNGNAVTSQHGLTIIPTGDINRIRKLNELHILRPDLVSAIDKELLAKSAIVEYTSSNKEYIFNQCLKRIAVQYGSSFENTVRLLLDYN